SFCLFSSITLLPCCADREKSPEPYTGNLCACIFPSDAKAENAARLISRKTPKYQPYCSGFSSILQGKTAGFPCFPLLFPDFPGRFRPEREKKRGGSALGLPVLPI